MKNLLSTILGFLVISFLMTSCDDGETSYDIPTTYSFENVDYSGQTQRLAMLTEMKNYLATANTTGTTLDADKLKAMYENTADAGFIGTYDETKQLKSKTFEGVQANFEGMFDAIVTASESSMEAAEGQAGVAMVADGSKGYLLNENGVEFLQTIEKGLMGACFYYQATDIYFGAGKMDVDNETVTEGKGTEMEHHWDEAFGYLGAPRDFPVSTDGLTFWSKYCNTTNAVLGTNQSLMNALLKGRAAISNKDIESRDEAISEARAEWEKVVAGTAMHYLNGSLESADDFAVRAHALSEAVAFVFSLQFNPAKTVTNAQVNELLEQLGGNADFLQMNFHNTTDANINAAKDALAGYMGWDAATADAL